MPHFPPNAYFCTMQFPYCKISPPTSTWLVPNHPPAMLLQVTSSGMPFSLAQKLLLNKP